MDWTQFVRRDGARLMLGGKRYEFVGAGNYYMMTRAIEPATRPQVVEVLQQAKQMGLSVLRVWAFNDGNNWQALQPKQGFLSVNALTDGLDWLISEAPKYGLRLVLVLTDSQDGYGGMRQYVQWGAPSTQTLRDFYTNRNIRRAFKAYIGALVLRMNSVTSLRYRDDPAVLGWEIANSLVCPGDDSGNILQGWIDDVAAHVKALDPNHLVMLGHSGLFGASTPNRWHANPATMSVGQPLGPWAYPYDAVCEGADWARNHESPHIDVAAIQLWPDDWTVAPEAWKLHWVRQWIREHVEVATALKKPLVISAYSKQRRTRSSTMATRNALFDLVHEEAARTPIIAGALFWLLASNNYPDYDGYTVYTSKEASKQPAPEWALMAPEQALSAYRTRAFLDTDKMLNCCSKRARGNTATDLPIDEVASSGSHWVHGWADVLDVINSHSQAMAALSSIPLSKAAMSHPVVERRRHTSLLLKNGEASPLQMIAADYVSPEKVRTAKQAILSSKKSGSATSQVRDQSSRKGTAGISLQAGVGGVKDASAVSHTRFDSSQAANLEFDTIGADEDVSGSFLARLGDTLGLTSIFGGAKAHSDESTGSRRSATGGDAPPKDSRFSLDETEIEAQALSAEVTNVFGNVKSWLEPSDTILASDKRSASMPEEKGLGSPTPQ